MPRNKKLNFYLPAHKHASVLGGEPGIETRVAQAVEAAGWKLRLRLDDETVGGGGYHLVYNKPVTKRRCLTLRRCYLTPFWRIEATNDRWDWDVAGLRFDPKTVPKHAPGFCTRTRDRLFGDLEIRRDGFIFMPLQGRLAEHRSFQSMSPLAMIDATLRADPKRRIIASLHPGEVYSSEETTALAELAAREPRFSLSAAGSMALLATCDHVVTENSGMALIGYFAQKPAVLFARIDFHHIAGLVPGRGVAAAFAQARGTEPPFAAYLFWFLKQQAITSWAEDVSDQILARFRRFDWPI